MHFLSYLIITPTCLLSAVIAAEASLRSLDNAPVLHFTLARRGGGFTATEHVEDNVNLTYLARELDRTEGRFNLTKREVKGNKLVRKAKTSVAGGKNEGVLMGDVAADGIWYATVSIGQPPQEIETDLNMLVSDFYVLTTTSRRGSRYDDFFSQSFVKSNDHPYPTCRLPTDVFRLPTVMTSLPLSFAHCRPSKFSQQTLGASGSTLGLAPSENLSQTGSTSLLKQLLDKKAIQRPIFSLMLINGQRGILSVGGTAASAIEMVVSQTKTELDRLGTEERESLTTARTDDLLTKRGRTNKEVVPRQAEWEEGWSWNKVQGAEGWWQLLTQGVWVDGSKVLQNQAVVIDINSPFILAPPLAAKAFYASVSGSYPLPPPFSNFYAFPCLNPPSLHFEFSGTKFPFMQGGRGAEWSGIPGGKFSLGRLKAGSGYCVGAVVETRMGVREEKSDILDEGRRGTLSGAHRGNLGGNGMRDVWVIGEGFFRSVGGVFDFKDHRVGFRTY